MISLTAFAQVEIKLDSVGTADENDLESLENNTPYPISKDSRNSTDTAKPEKADRESRQGGTESIKPNRSLILDKEPVPLNMSDVKRAIGYPEEARKKEIEGKVMVQLLIDEEGNYLKHKFVQRVHPILDEAVSKKIHLLKFTPAILEGAPSICWVTAPFEFKLMRPIKENGN